MIVATLLVIAAVTSERPFEKTHPASGARAEFAAQDRKDKDKPPVGKPAGTPGRAMKAGQTGERGTSPAGVVTSITEGALRIRVGNVEQVFSLSETTVVVGSKVVPPKDKPLPITKLVAVGDLVVVDYVTVTVLRRAETIRILPPAPATIGRPAATPGAAR